ncbi:unnamed protein product [Gongylonema pulchrum]|uniref:RING-type domain-containing protein n=1 Tax=Gongylonema pulchrum TaxID=637853 RepID=A0A183CVN2_9BILA|nr:unnamed protein product [Gongylonema pulchrum]
MYNFAREFIESTPHWRAVLENELALTALHQLDHMDRGVSRAAARFVLHAVKSKKLFDVFDAEEVVIPRVHSLIVRKERHWIHISASFVPLIECFLADKTPTDGRKMLVSFSDAFVDGCQHIQLQFHIFADGIMQKKQLLKLGSTPPYAHVFEIPCDVLLSEVWVNSFEAFIELAAEWTANKCTADDFTALTDALLTKVLIGVRYSLDWDDIPLTRKLAELPRRIFDLWSKSPETVSELRVKIERYLTSELSRMEPVIEAMFRDEVEPVWSSFVERVLESAVVSLDVKIHLLERCSEHVLKDINDRLPLCQFISEKIDWSENEDIARRLLKLLFRLSAVFDRRVAEFYKFDVESAFLRLLDTFEWLDVNERSGAAQYIGNDEILDRAVDYCMEQTDRKRWDVLLDIISSLPYLKTALQRILERNRYNRIDQELLLSLLNKLGLQLEEQVRAEFAESVLNYYIGLKSISPELIRKVVLVMMSSGVNVDFVAQFIASKLLAADFPSHGVQVAIGITDSLPHAFAPFFLMNIDDMAEKFDILDKKVLLPEFILTQAILQKLLIFFSVQ